MNRTFCAVDVERAYARLGLPKAPEAPHIRPIALGELPTTRMQVLHDAGNHAVLSWRWDVHPQARTSSNVAAALVHAFNAGIEHLFIDFISVDQGLAGVALIHAVADFTSLFGQVRVVAAYDTPGYAEEGRHFLRTLRRPWIAREILAMRRNPNKIDYVGHIRDQGAHDTFGISHMMERIWTTPFANSMLYVLMGYCDMHHVAELPLIMPEHAPVLTAAADCMTRNDALLTAAILSQTPTFPRVNGDINLREVKLDRYVFTSTEASAGFWKNWDIALDGRRVATWSEKDHTRDGGSRRKLTVEDGTEFLISAHFNLEPPIPDAPPVLKTSAERLEKEVPKVAIIDLSSRFRS